MTKVGCQPRALQNVFWFLHIFVPVIFVGVSYKYWITSWNTFQPRYSSHFSSFTHFLQFLRYRGRRSDHSVLESAEKNPNYLLSSTLCWCSQWLNVSVWVFNSGISVPTFVASLTPTSKTKGTVDALSVWTGNLVSLYWMCWVVNVPILLWCVCVCMCG